MYTKESLKEWLKDMVNSTNEMTGRPRVDISDSDIPVGIGGFDSINGFECSAEIEAELHIKIPGCGNIFYSQDGKRALQLCEIVEKVFWLSEGRKAS